MKAQVTKSLHFFNTQATLKFPAQSCKEPCPQECWNYDNVSDAVNIQKIAEESDLTSDSKIYLFNKSSEMASLSNETTTDPFAQYPQECFDLGRSGSAVGNKEISKKDDELAYIKILFTQIITELLLISSSKR